MSRAAKNLSAASVWRQPAWLIAAGLTVGLTSFHVWFLFHAGGFWRDEVNLINLAARPTLAAMSQDSFPVLMPLLVRGWTALGGANSDLALRALGTLIGLSILAALWLTAWQARRGAPLVSLVLLGFNSTLIIFGDSLRAYGLGCCFIVLTAAAALAWLRENSWPRTLWLTLLAAASVQTLYHNAVLVGAICLGLAAVCVREKNWRGLGQTCLAGVVAALSLWPYLAPMLAGKDSAQVIRSGLKADRFFAAFQDVLGFPDASFFYVWLAFAVAAVVLAVAAWRRAVDFATRRQIFSGLTLLAAAVGYVLFLWAAGFPSQSWYLLPLVALGAACLEAIWEPTTRRGWFELWSGALVVLLLAVPATQRDLRNRFTNVDFWAKQLNRYAAPGDFIAITPWFCGITFNHYFRRDVNWETIPPLTDHATHRYDLVQHAIQDTNIMSNFFAQAETALRAGRRVWVLAGAGLMRLPEAGEAAPSSLPAAPLPRTGWSEAPFTMVWNAQLARQLANQAERFQRVENPTVGQNFFENTELFVAEGWRATAPLKTTSSF